MDFGALSPEVNSARMYTGPGSAPMLAAATAWAALAAELGAAAASYESVVSELISEGWMGSASASMAAAAAHYVVWMSDTGAYAEQTSAQATAAAAAFEAAFAMTVPPAEVTANRALQATLVLTNCLGQNTAAIAITEAQYGEMWAQDAAAMYGYAGGAAAASTLPPFAEPQETTNPAGLASQAATISQITGAAAGIGAQPTVDQVMSAVPTALQSLSSPAASVFAEFDPTLGLPPEGILAAILNFLDGNDGNPYGIFFNSSLTNGFTSAGYLNPGIISPAVTAGMADINALVVGAAPQAAIPPMGSGAGNATWGPLVSPAASIGLPSLGGVSAGANQAALVGRLSVPQSWTEAVQVVNHAGTALPGGGWTGTAIGSAGTPGVPGVPGVPGAGTYGYNFAHGPRYGFRPTIMARPPAAG